MAKSNFTCPNCKTHIPVKVIALAGAINGRGRLTEFEQITSSPNHSTSTKNGFWNSDVATYVVTGLFVFGLVWLYVWWYGYNPLWAVATGLIAGLGLAVLKTILYAPARPVQPKKPSSTTIKKEGEQWTNNRSKPKSVSNLRLMETLSGWPKARLPPSKCPCKKSSSNCLGVGLPAKSN